MTAAAPVRTAATAPDVESQPSQLQPFAFIGVLSFLVTLVVWPRGAPLREVDYIRTQGYLDPANFGRDPWVQAFARRPESVFQGAVAWLVGIGGWRIYELIAPFVLGSAAFLVTLFVLSLSWQLFRSRLALVLSGLFLVANIIAAQATHSDLFTGERGAITFGLVGNAAAMYFAYRHKLVACFIGLAITAAFYPLFAIDLGVPLAIYLVLARRASLRERLTSGAGLLLAWSPALLFALPWLTNARFAPSPATAAWTREVLRWLLGVLVSPTQWVRDDRPFAVMAAGAVLVIVGAWRWREGTDTLTPVLLGSVLAFVLGGFIAVDLLRPPLQAAVLVLPLQALSIINVLFPAFVGGYVAKLSRNGSIGFVLSLSLIWTAAFVALVYLFLVCTVACLVFVSRAPKRIATAGMSVDKRAVGALVGVAALGLAIASPRLAQLGWLHLITGRVVFALASTAAIALAQLALPADAWAAKLPQLGRPVLSGLLLLSLIGASLPNALNFGSAAPGPGEMPYFVLNPVEGHGHAVSLARASGPSGCQAWQQAVQRYTPEGAVFLTTFPVRSGAERSSLFEHVDDLVPVSSSAEYAELVRSLFAAFRVWPANPTASDISRAFDWASYLDGLPASEQLAIARRFGAEYLLFGHPLADLTPITLCAGSYYLYSVS